MEFTTKHYIRLNGIFIIKAFSTAFEQPIDGDICVNEDGGRHYNLNIYNANGLPNLKYINGEILETTDIDLADKIAEREACILANPSMETRIKKMEDEIKVMKAKDLQLDEKKQDKIT